MSDTRTVTLQVSGMIRATSKNVTEAHLSRQPGVIAVDANPVSQTATVTYDPELAAPAADLALLDDDDDLPLPLPRQLDPAMQRTARLASLDPNDGIEL